MVNIIIFIVVALILLRLLGALIVHFPILIWILSPIILVLVWSISNSWWIGAIVGFLSVGALSILEQICGGKQCSHCKSHNTYLFDKHSNNWCCKKCGGYTIYY